MERVLEVSLTWDVPIEELVVISQKKQIFSYLKEEIPLYDSEHFDYVVWFSRLFNELSLLLLSLLLLLFDSLFLSWDTLSRE